MSEDFNSNFGCDSSDCASCSGCGPDSSCEGCSGGSSPQHSTITLTMDDDTEVTCAVLTTYPVGEKHYIALLPLDENGQNTQGEVYLYTFATGPSGDPLLSNIEDDDEYQAAADAFDQIVENARLVAAADPEEA